MATQRNMHFATIVYPLESAPKDWIEKIEDQHIQALISPLHDKDIDKEGNPKKPHHHVILIFESLKSQKQVKEITDTFGGVGVIPCCSSNKKSNRLADYSSRKRNHYRFSVILQEHGSAHYSELKIPPCKLIAQGYSLPEKSEWELLFFCQRFRMFITQIRIQQASLI